jgi:hypothetical protein
MTPVDTTIWRNNMWYILRTQHRKRYMLLANAAGFLVILAFALALLSPRRAPVIQADERGLDPTPTGDGAYQPNPFPITETMTDTVQLVLSQYLAPQPNVPQALAAQEFTPLGNVSAVYLPMIQRQGPATPPTPRPQPRERADIAVTTWPEPSIYVMRGGRLVYDLRITNYDSGSAEHTRVTLPYDRRQMRPIGSRLEGAKGDWVSRVTDRAIEVTFGEIAGKAGRSGQLVFEVATTLGNDTVLDMRPTYEWSDDQGDRGPYATNWAPVLVGNGPATAPWVWTQVTPTSGAPGTTHTFLSNRFAPDEGIVTWLNTPSGVRALDLRGVADRQGVITLSFSSAGLSPGSYQLVLYGARSKLTGVATFIVR